MLRKTFDAVKDRFLTLWFNFLDLSLFKKVLILFSFVFVIGFGSFALLFLVVKSGYFGDLPSYQHLRNIRNNLASEIYTSDQKLLGKYFIQERTRTKYEDLSPELVKALIATEDARFFSHQGIDYRSLARVAVKSLLLQNESSGGGSTITQQLAKNLYPRQTHGILTIPVNKLKEMLVARRLEKVYQKEEIISLYLNTVPFGENAFGVESAAERFFSKDPAELSVAEAAVLVGMLKATSYYNPRKNPLQAQGRRNVVLEQMVKYQYLDRTLADSLKKTEIKLAYHNLSHSEGLAPYFREHLRRELTGWFRNNPKPDGSKYNIYTDGLKIYTTLDSRMQYYAEQAVAMQMKDIQKVFFQHWGKNYPWGKSQEVLMDAVRRTQRYRKLKASGLTDDQILEAFKNKEKLNIFTWEGEKEKEISPLDSIIHHLYYLNAGFMAMDPGSGEVLAWVGGINHQYFKYDHVNLNTKRQIGSTFKPIVYASALENGIDPCEYFSNERKTYEEYENWSPRNSDNHYEGFYSMEGALTNSVNTVAVDLLLQSGIDNTVNLAHQLGIDSKVESVPSIALGTPSISLYEMVSAYSVFANNGVRVKPKYLLYVEDQDGNIIADFREENYETRVISPTTNNLLIQMLRSVVNKGTAARLRTMYQLPNDLAGKTGTTQSNADGWFIGFTPGLVAGAWVGSDDPRIHFRTVTLGQGANTALPIFARFLQQVNKNKEFARHVRTNFPEPDIVVKEMLACEHFKEEDKEKKDMFELFDQLFKRSEGRKIQYPPKKQEQRPQRDQEKKKRTKFGKFLRDIFN